MRVVVDTNIVFSALMSADNTMGEILLNAGDSLQFFAPELLLEELDRYSAKLQKASRLSAHQLSESRKRVLASVTMVSEYLISEGSVDAILTKWSPWCQSISSAKGLGVLPMP